MHTKPLELTKLILDATRKRRIIWRRDGLALHHAEFAGLQCSLHFKHPVLSGDDGSDADVVEVSAGRSAFTFYSGTEGFELAGEILAAAYPEVEEQHRKFAANLDETIKKIRNHAA